MPIPKGIDDLLAAGGKPHLIVGTDVASFIDGLVRTLPDEARPAAAVASCEVGGDEPSLRIEHRRVGRSGREVYVTIRIDDAVVFADRLDVTKDRTRERLVERIGDSQSLAAAERDRIAGALLLIATSIMNDNRTPSKTEENVDPAQLLAAMPKEAVAAAEAMLASRELLKTIVDDIAALGVAGERKLTATLYLVGTSRLLDRPLAAIVQGPTSSGKSFAIEKTSELFPREAVLRATRITPQALFHMPPGSLRHRFIVAGERSRKDDGDTAEATRALREMLSSGRLSKIIPVKVCGAFESRLVEQDGPIAFVESTTQENIFEEDRNRCILLTTDEQRDQTSRILCRLGKDYAGHSATEALSAIIEKHHALQRLLKPYSVVVPFAEKLSEYFPTQRVEARRAFPQLVSTIQACTLLHQRQRKLDDAGRLVAKADDYAIARRLLAGSLGRSIGGRVSEPAWRFCRRLQDFASEVGSGEDSGTFTTSQAIDWERRGENSSCRSVRGWLQDLYRSGLVTIEVAGRGRNPTRWKLAMDAILEFDGEDFLLPTVEQVCDLEHWIPEVDGE